MLLSYVLIHKSQSRRIYSGTQVLRFLIGLGQVRLISHLEVFCSNNFCRHPFILARRRDLYSSFIFLSLIGRLPFIVIIKSPLIQLIRIYGPLQGTANWLSVIMMLMKLFSVLQIGQQLKILSGLVIIVLVFQMVNYANIT